MKGEVWKEERILKDIRDTLIHELDGIVSVQKVNELILECGDDLSTMEFILQKYKYHTSVDEEFKFEAYKSLLNLPTTEVQVVKVLSYLSVFEYIGYDNDKQADFEIICKELLHEEVKIVREIISFCLDKGIISKKGDFIRLNEFRYWFFSFWINEHSQSKIPKLIEVLERTKTAKSFSKAVVNYCDKIHASKFILSLTKENGVLNDRDFINTDTGSKLVFNLVELDNNIEILKALTIAIGKYSQEELRVEFKLGRRYIIWALEKLVFREETFESAAKLLFRFAVSENEEIGNNAIAQFIQLFQIGLPGTEVNLEIRLKFLKELQKEAIDKTVVVLALDRALMTSSFTRMGGADEQAGVKYYDYRPESDEEILSYWETVIDMLLEMEEYDVITSKLNTQVYYGHSEAIITAVEKVVSIKNEIDKDLRQQFEYLINQERDLSFEIKERIQAILDQYSEQSIRAKLEFMVALAPYSTYKSQDGVLLNRSEEKAKELARELVNSGNDNWLNDIDILLSNEQRLSFSFGKNISELKQNYSELIEKVIGKLVSIPFENQNNSLIIGYISGNTDQVFVRKIIDSYLSRKEIEFHSIHMTKNLQMIEFEDLKKLYALINENPTFVVSLQYIKLEELKTEDFIVFINWIKVIEPFGWWAAIDICTRNIDHIIGEKAIQELIQELLYKKGLLRCENTTGGLSMHDFLELFKKLDENGLDTNFVVFISNEIIDLTLDYSVRIDWHIRDILVIIFDKYWDVSWDVFSTRMLDPAFYGSYELKKMMKQYSGFEDEKLLKWMDQFPNEAPQKIIDFVRSYFTEGDKYSWNPLFLKMFKKYHSNLNFKNSLSSELHSYTWAGSLVPLFEGRKSLFVQLLDHPEQAIKDFAIENVKYFEENIKREKRRDENYGLDF
jgi:hypothetical protein